MIWCDLDGTLVQAVPLPLGDQQRARTPFVDFSIGGETYRGAVRLGAIEFLKALRALDSVRLLTFSHRAYAEEICLRFGLGFSSTEIAAQPDWWGSFLSPQPLKRQRPADSIDVLVANKSDPMNEAKMGWLGPGARLVVVPDFTGSGDDVFAMNWERYVNEIFAALSGAFDSDDLDRMEAKDLLRHLEQQGAIVLRRLVAQHRNEYYDAEEVASHCGIPRETLLEWSSAGLVIAFARAGAPPLYPIVQFHQERVEAWAAEIIRHLGAGAPAVHFLLVPRRRLGGVSFATELRSGRRTVTIDAMRATLAEIISE